LAFCVAKVICHKRGSIIAAATIPCENRQDQRGEYWLRMHRAAVLVCKGGDRPVITFNLLMIAQGSIDQLKQSREWV